MPQLAHQLPELPELPTTPNWGHQEKFTLKCLFRHRLFKYDTNVCTAASMGIHLSTLSRRCCWCLVLLSKLVDGLGQAAVPGVAGHQHQEGHGDHLHRAGDIGQIWVIYQDAWISPPGAQRPLLRDGQLPPLVALLLPLLLHRLLLLGQALLGSVWLGRRHLLEVYWQRSDARVAAMLVQALLCNLSSWT